MPNKQHLAKETTMVDIEPTTIDANRRQWVQLFPWGESITLVDGRGPYRLTEPEARAVLANWALVKDPLLVDYEHRSMTSDDSTASGWLQAMVAVLESDSGQIIDDGDGQSFADNVPDMGDMTPGVWGLVQWTPTAAQQITDKEYRKLSPVFWTTEDGSVQEIDGLTLTNVPALGNKLRAAAKAEQNTEEETMADKPNTESWQKTALTLGIQANTEDEFRAKIKAMKERADKADELERDLATEKKAREGLEADKVTAEAEKVAATVVDEAIKDGQVPEKARQAYIDMHVENPEKTMATIDAVPKGTIKVETAKEEPPQGRQGASVDEKRIKPEDGEAQIMAATKLPADVNISQERLDEANQVLAKMGDAPDYSKKSVRDRARRLAFRQVAGGGNR